MSDNDKIAAICVVAVIVFLALGTYDFVTM